MNTLSDPVTGIDFQNTAKTPGRTMEPEAAAAAKISSEGTAIPACERFL